jgi:Flp pilus assembly secretin CpaC
MAYKLLSAIVFEEWQPSEDIPAAKDNKAQTALLQDGFGFKIAISNASVNTGETNFTISITNSSLIGFESTGVPRISQSGTVTQNISLPNNSGSFIIGGVKKQELVKADNGFPWLSRIPVAGYLFGSKGDSVKDSELVIVGECISIYPELKPQTRGKSRSYSI